MADPIAELTQARRDLATALGCSPAVPDVIDPPCLVMQPGQPYLDNAEYLYGSYDLKLNIEVYAFTTLEDNETAADTLDALVVQVIGALPQGWGIATIGQPQPYLNGDFVHHGIRIDVSRTITI